MKIVRWPSDSRIYGRLSLSTAGLLVSFNTVWLLVDAHVSVVTWATDAVRRCLL